MTPETILTNARIILADTVIEGTLVLRDGLIADFQEYLNPLPAARVSSTLKLD
jgi:alpha-D-ribose 1-methylphosphonate 5-triphosphate diphosphatase PhnM